MDYFVASGVFWMPGAAHRRVPGELRFDADGVELLLHDSLEEFVLPSGQAGKVVPEWKTLPVVHGRLHDDRETTLLDVAGLSTTPGPFHSVHERWSVAFALTGGLTTRTVYHQALIEFDALMAWADPPGIAIDGHGPDSVVVDPATVTLATATLDSRTELRLLSGGAGTWSHSRVSLEQWCAFQVDGAALPVRRILDEWVRPLQDLLLVCLGRPVRLTALHLRPPGVDARANRLTASFAAVQPPPASPPTLAQLEAYTAPTLLTVRNSPIPLVDLLRRWYELRASRRSAVVLFCGPYYAPFIYGEHRYASTFQAAEALAREQFETTDKTAERHRQRVAAVITAITQAGLEPEDVAWATAVLKSRNDKPLRLLIEELAAATGEVGQLVLDASPQFGRNVARARTGVSHGGAKETALIRRHWLGEALSWIVRANLLHQAGIPLAILAERVAGKPRFRQALTELAVDT